MIKRIILVFIGTILLTSFGACTIINDNTTDDAARIARDDFGFNNIIFVASGRSNSILSNGSVGRRGIWYVIGEREEQSILLIVPREKVFAPYEEEWPLVLTLLEIIEKINARAQGVIFKDEDFDINRIVFHDHPEFVKSAPIPHEEVDVLFVIFFYQLDGKHLWVFQKDNQIIITNEDGTIFE